LGNFGGGVGEVILYIPSVKIAIARRQLGTALSLFLADEDPVSVHCLACGGAEIADFLAKNAGSKSFSQHALKVHPDMKPKDLVYLRNQYWNAMKHALRKNGAVRDDNELLERFDDKHNDHSLFVGWYDYAAAVGCIPIEAQAFQVWYFANYPEKLIDGFPTADIEEQFPRIREMKRSEKKRALKRSITWAKRQPDIMQDPKTDRRKLVLGPIPAL
jgi:hypothetical protein